MVAYLISFVNIQRCILNSIPKHANTILKTYSSPSFTSLVVLSPFSPFISELNLMFVEFIYIFVCLFMLLSTKIQTKID